MEALENRFGFLVEQLVTRVKKNVQSTDNSHYEADVVQSPNFETQLFYFGSLDFQSIFELPIRLFVFFYLLE